jgi:hypothetical protein
MPRRWADPKAAQAAKQGVLARRRALWLGTGLAGIVIVAVVIGAVLQSASKSGRLDGDTRIERKVSTLLDGIPQEGQTLGLPNAPVTLQVFADLEDEDTQHWILQLLPKIIKVFVRTNILKIEFLSFKTNTIHPETFVKQQAAALSAGVQDKLWNFIDTFYNEQGKEYTPYVTEPYLENIASQVPGLNMAQWHEDRNNGRRSEQVVTEDQTAKAEGIHVTPAYRLGLTGQPPKNFMGSEAITFFNRGGKQKHPTTFASADDIAKAIKALQ